MRQPGGIFLVGLCLWTPILFAGENTLVVQLNGFLNGDGKGLLSVFNSEETFSDDPIYVQRFDISGDQMTLILDDFPDGEVAVLALHDENADEELNTNFLGIPKEGIGMSLPPGTSIFGPPQYEKLKFTPQSGDTLQIEIKYLFR